MKVHMMATYLIFWLILFHVKTTNSVIPGGRENLCIALECISPGTQRFRSDGRPTDSNQIISVKGSSCFQHQSGLGGFAYKPNPSIDECGGPVGSASDRCASPIFEINPIFVDGKIMHGWFHLHVDTQAISRDLFDGLVITSQGSHNSMIDLVPIGQFTLDFLDKCKDGLSDGAKNVNATSTHIVPCHATPINQAEHPNVFVFTTDFNSVDLKPTLLVPIQPQFRINWKMTPQFGCNPIKFLQFRVGVAFGYHVAGGVARAVATYWNASKLITFDTSKMYGVSDPVPPFNDETPVDCRSAATQLKPTLSDNVKTQLQIQSIDDRNRPINLLQCTKHRTDGKEDPTVPTSTLTEDAQIYLGRCAEEISNDKALHWYKVTNKPSEQQGLTCGPPDASPIYKDLKSIEEYINDTRYDFCDCFDKEIDPGLVETVTDIPVTPEPDPFPPDPPLGDEYDLDSRSEEFSQRSGLLDGDEEYFKFYNSTRDAWRKRLWLSRLLHGSFAVSTFFFFVPVAIFYSRYLKEAYNGSTLFNYDIFYAVRPLRSENMAHVILIVMGFIVLCFSQTASKVALVYAGSLGSPHSFIGYSIIPLYIICFILGPIRHASWLLTSIWIHVGLGLLVYLNGLVTIVTGTLVTTDNKPLMPSMQGLCVICLIAARLLIDIVFHIFMTKYSRKGDDELQLDKKRMICPTVMKIQENGSPTGTGCRKTMLIIYAIISAILCLGYVVIIVVLKSEDEEKAIFEDTVKFNKILENYGIH